MEQWQTYKNWQSGCHPGMWRAGYMTKEISFKEQVEREDQCMVLGSAFVLTVPSVYNTSTRLQCKLKLSCTVLHLTCLNVNKYVEEFLRAKRPK